MDFRHISVLPEEATTLLNCQPNGIYVDGTLGGGGHARCILDQLGPRGAFIGIDQDPAAIENARISLGSHASKIILVHDNFVNLPTILSQLGISSIDGILVDLGLSLYQLEQSGRGFSFQKNEPLDMRMNPGAHLSAADIVNTYSETDIANILFQYGEEKKSRQIARKIVAQRNKQPLQTSKELADIVSGVILKTGRIHPATRTFMALRIAVNEEISRLEMFLEECWPLLNPGGRLCVISFHSLEDRLVKRAFRQQSTTCTCPKEIPRCICNTKPVVRVITPKAIRATKEEIEKNPMARSALLRVAEKLPDLFLKRVFSHGR